MKKLNSLLLSGAVLLSSTSLLAQISPTLNTPEGYYKNYPTYTPPASEQPAPAGKSAPAAVPSAPSGVLKWVNTYSEAVAQSQSTGKPIVILFTGTNWCPACMKLEKEVLKSSEFAQMVGQKFIFLKAEFPDYSNVAASPFKTLLDRYGIEAFPTIVVVNASGQQLYTVNYREGGARAYAQELLQKLK